MLRGGILMSIGNFLEVLSQAILVGIMLVGRLGIRPFSSTIFSQLRSPSLRLLAGRRTREVLKRRGLTKLCVLSFRVIVPDSRPEVADWLPEKPLIVWETSCQRGEFHGFVCEIQWLFEIIAGEIIIKYPYKDYERPVPGHRHIILYHTVSY